MKDNAYLDKLYLTHTQDNMIPQIMWDLGNVKTMKSWLYVINVTLIDFMSGKHISQLIFIVSPLFYK